MTKTPSRPHAAAALLALLTAVGASPAARADYGDKGTQRMGLILGFGGSQDGFYGEAGADYGYFVVPRVAPGIEATIQGGKGLLTTGMVMPNVHLVPFREGSFALLLSGRAGRVLVADHGDGWGVGAGVGAAVFQTARLGFQIGYQYLRLYPRSFCADIVDGCAIHGLSVGFIAGF